MIEELRGQVAAWLERHLVLKFIWQTIKSLFFVVVIFTLLAWVPDLPAAYAWGFIYALPVIVAAIIWFTARLWRRHGTSAVLSVVATIAILSTIQYASMRRDAVLAIVANIDVPLRPEEKVQVVDLSDFMPSCSAGCMEVIADTEYRVLLGDHLYWAVRDKTCREERHRSSYFTYLKAGYASTCVGEAKVQRPSRLLIVDDLYCNYPEDGGPECKQLPASFAGRIVTVRLVTSESDRIVQRWLEGGIRPYNGWFALVGLESLPVGEWRDHAEVLSRILGTEIHISNVTGNDDFDAVLTELEAFLDDPQYSQQASLAFWFLSEVRGRDNQSILKRHITTLIARDDRAHVLAGLNLVTNRSNVDASDNRARIVALSASADPAISDLAHRALRHIDRK